jgi:hypothetical protein
MQNDKKETDDRFVICHFAICHLWPMLLVLAGAMGAARVADAQSFPDRALRPPQSPVVAAPPVTPERSDPFDALLRKVALDLLPSEYIDDDDWGKTQEFVTGLDIERDGLRIETRRRRKQLNHGEWEHYAVTLADDTQFDLQVKNRRSLDDGRVAFDVHLMLPLQVIARQAQWRRGVQLYSVHADANMLVRVEVECVTAIIFDTASFPPAVVMKPSVTAARARLVDFELNRLSKIGGDVAEELGRAARGRIERRIAAKDEKLTRKINEQLAKREDALRLSWAALAETGWKQLIELPEKD